MLFYRYHNIMLQFQSYKMSTSLLSFLALCLIGQVYIGNSILNNSWGLLLYPCSSFLFGFIYFYATKHFPDEKRSLFQSKSSYFALVTSLFITSFWFLSLLAQVKSLEISSNPITNAIINLLTSFGNYQNIFLALVALVIFFLIKRNELKSLIYIDRKIIVSTLLISLAYILLALLLGHNFKDFFSRYWEYLIIAGIPEEVIFRYLMLGGLLSLGYFSSIGCIIISAIIFGLFHLPINIESMGIVNGVVFCIVGNAFGGLLFGYFFYKTRSLLALIFLHALIDTLLNV